MEETQLRVLFKGELLSVHPRAFVKEVNRLSSQRPYRLRGLGTV
ncbi:hypothetical protein [Nonomuraea indica]|nr:hypothetical protein [Nonomuraea indica]